MSPCYVALKSIHWGGGPQVVHRRLATFAWLLMVMRIASADPVTATVPDAPARPQPVVVAPSHAKPSWDLDGTYLWLGPIGAASYLDAKWDSTFGGEAAIVVIRERAPIGL